MNTLFDTMNIWNISCCKYINQEHNHYRANFCSHAYKQIFSVQSQKSVGFAVIEGNSVEMVLTTEVIKDEMLFIAFILYHSHSSSLYVPEMFEQKPKPKLLGMFSPVNIVH